MNLIVQILQNSEADNRVKYTINKPVVYIRGDMVVTVSKDGN